MLFNAAIAMQPNKEVLIERRVPTKVFAKLFHQLTQGVLSPKEKHQTFTAISILQELNIALRQAGIVNIVRLAKDGNDFYFDKQGKDDDLSEAMREFRLNTDAMEETLFNDLYLVLEHRDDVLNYLIEIDIKRVHLAEQMPINITIEGVINQFCAQQGETAEQLQSRVSDALKDKHRAEHFSDYHRAHFEQFAQSLGQTLKSAIRCEQFSCNVKPKVMRPKVRGNTSVADAQRAPLAYRGYPGWETAVLYTFLWMPAMESVAADYSNVDIIDDGGDLLYSVGDDATQLTDSPLFDLDVDSADLPTGSDRLLDGSSFGDDGGSSWLDFGGDGGGSDGGCSSCSSGCGGGCGS